MCKLWKSLYKKNQTCLNRRSLGNKVGDENNDPSQDSEVVFKGISRLSLIIGLGLILLAYLTKHEFIPFLKDFPKAVYFLELAHYLFESLGIASILASVFTFTLETNHFLHHIRKILANIVISKDFLRNLSVDDKRQALKNIMRPSTDQERIYTNISGYFDKHIDESLNLFGTNFKTNQFIHSHAHWDQKGKIFIDTLISYRLYRVDIPFEDLSAGFDNENSKLLRAEIIGSKGQRHVIKGDQVCRQVKNEESGCVWWEYHFEVPQDCAGLEYITVTKHLREYGDNLWKSLNYKHIRPSDGFTATLRCEKDMEIMEYMIYDNEGNYRVHLSEDNQYIEILCTQWIKPGVGFNIFVGKKNDLEKNDTGISAQTAPN